MRSAALLSLCCLVGACGDPRAPEKCQALLDAACEAAALNCLPPTPTEECLAAFETETDCSRAFDVSEGYDACLEELEGYEYCIVPEWGLPDPCEGVVFAVD